MKTSPEFEEAYQKLNDAQREAVDTIDGPVFVIAGPGTGKTQVLTLRIANILLKTDTPPDAILALTFTESAASTLRERLSRLTGSATAWKVRIHTFHGFAEYLIGRYPDAFPRIVGGQIASDVERAELLEAALLKAEVTHLRPYGDPLYYYGACARAIETLKRENVRPDALRARIAAAEAEFDATPDKVHEKGKYAGKMKGEFESLKKKIEKTHDLAAVYEAYEQGLTEAKRYDFADLILEAERALSDDEALKRQMQESVHYVLADEHQDANASQNALLELLTDYDDRPNLFIVGDEKQAIYRFQGADLDSVHYFRTRFPQTRIIALVENYRSTQTILDLALSLVAASPDERLSRVPLTANASAPARPITLLSCATPESEMHELVQAVRARLEAGTPAEEIAVFGRRNQDVALIAQALTIAGIAVSAGTDGGALEGRFVRALIRLLRAVAEPSDEHLALVLALPAFPLSAADSWRMLQAARSARIPVFSFMRDPLHLEEAKIADPDTVRALGSLIETLAREASYERPAVIAAHALRVSGLVPKMLAAADRAESLASVRAFLKALEELARREHDAGLARMLQVLNLYEERGIALGLDASEVPGRVRVMTVHRAKGREFAEVFVPRLTESAWSTRARPEHFHLPDLLSGSAELEDERRLLYVAITRAKAHATLSYARTRDSGKDDAPSVLLEDLAPELLELRSSALPPEDTLLAPLPLERASDQPTSDDLDTLRHAFLAQGLSPTALNNYLECPWKYFYVNLLRLPQAETKFMLYGTAIHAALYRYALLRAQGTEPGVEALTASFLHALARAPLSTLELDELTEKGKRALLAWWMERHEAWPVRTSAEEAVQAELTLPGGETLLLRGKLDRIDEAAGGVAVIDYKTGKPKSRNELMGATKSGSGDYYRQLTFYKLLLERSEPARAMTEGVIEFVEPDDAGKIRTESFAISAEEVAALEETIKGAASAILSLSFWNDRCSEKDCEWCALRYPGLEA